MAAADQSPLQVTQGALWPSSLRAPMPEVKPVVTHPVAARPATTVEERLRESAVREARRWNLCATQGDVSCLEERRKEIELALRNAVQEVRKLEKSEIAGRIDARWLLDNFNLFQLSLQEVREALATAKELPQVENAGLRRVPRAFAIAEGFVRAADYKFDAANFSIYANAVQEDSALVFAEIGLLSPLAQLAVLERAAELASKIVPNGAAAADAAPAEQAEENADASLPVLVASLRCIVDTNWREIFEEISATGLILREDPAGAYGRLDAEGREAYCRVVAELSARSNWNEEQIARKAVALASAPQIASTVRGRERRSHVGFYLVENGLKTLKQAIGYRPTFSQRIQGAILRWPELFYLIAIEFVTLTVMNEILNIPAAKLAAVMVAALFFFPVLECAVGVVNLLATLVVRPQRLPRLDFSEGIPADCVTMAVVPTLLMSEEQVQHAARDLEIRFLGNRDANLHFALLTDLPDSLSEFDERDRLAGMCSDLIRALNDKYAHEGKGSFFHFYRPRIFNPAEGVWMGWERKRGKILDFNHLLLGKHDRFSEKVGDLSVLPSVRYVITLDLDTQLPRDAAHKLIGAIAHPLNRAVIHPATNTVVEGYGILQPRVDICAKSAAKSRLSAILSGDAGFDIYTRAVSDVYQDLFGEGSFTGKGIYEVAAFQQVLESRFPNNAVLSHDLIEGAYARAGLISDVEVVDDYPSHFSAFSKRKHRWVRGDWQILSWLFPRVTEASGRRVRNPLNVVSRWKIVDNLRRSVTEFATFALLLCGWLVLPGKALYWTLATVALAAFPSFLQTALTIVRARRALFSPVFWWNTLSDLGKANVQLFFRLTFLCHQSLVTLDAVVRTIVRMAVTHRSLLNWETAAEAETEAAAAKISPVEIYLNWTPFLSLLIAALIAATRPYALAAAAPFLILWASSKVVCRWLDRPRRAERSSIAAGDRELLRQSALRTWRFFREHSNAEENWLVPDTVQEEAPGLAHRISPTNLGFLLTSRLAACDLGFLTLPEFIAATERTLQTARELPKFNGHFYNWYDTLTLEPVPPRFISTVDNGNLVCSLWTLKQGCLEAKAGKVFDRPLWQGLIDHLELLRDALEQAREQILASKFEALIQRLPLAADSAAKWLAALPEIENEIIAIVDEVVGANCSSEIQWWAQESRTRTRKLIELVYDFAPWLSPVYAQILEQFPIADSRTLNHLTIENAGRIYRGLHEILKGVEAAEGVAPELLAGIALLRSALSRSEKMCEATRDALDELAEDADELAAAMDFSFLYNRQRKLLSIGYDADTKTVSDAHYDLLASEARAASFVAIAKGEIPQESWFRLGRSHTTFRGTHVLLSWTGTMFEYLMPSLWMKTYPNTLLEHNERAALRSQQKYARKKSIPWGISESSSSERNPDGFHRYRAFGVPALALSQDDSDDLVVSPYSTFLGLAVDAAGSAKNLRRMKKMGWLGAYGFFESVDFTASRIGSTRKFEVVRCWLAHHQGMSLSAAASVLCESSMQRRFHAEPMVAATERILHERMPRLLKVRPAEIAGAVASTLIGHGRVALQRAQSWSSSSPDLTVPVHRAS
jgi:cyclic beta-1,2-glucan synthetase